MGDGEIHRRRRGDIQLGVISLRPTIHQIGKKTRGAGVTTEVINHLRVVGHAKASAGQRLHQQAGVETGGRVVTLDLDVFRAQAKRRHFRTQLAADTVERRTETCRNLVVERIADRRLDRDDLNLAFIAKAVALEAVFIVGDQTKRGINAQCSSIGVTR